jgi:hypothetical protein
VPENNFFYMIVGLVKPNSGIYFWMIWTLTLSYVQRAQRKLDI